MWSPHFVPRPKDWPEYVDIVGTIFSDTIPSFSTSTSPSTPISSSISTLPVSPTLPLPLSNSHTNSPSTKYFGSSSCFNSRSGSKSSFFSHSNYNSKLDSSCSENMKSSHTPVRQEKSVDNDYSPPIELLAFFSPNSYFDSNSSNPDSTTNLNSNSNSNSESVLNTHSTFNSNPKIIEESNVQTRQNEFQKSGCNQIINQRNSEKATVSVEVNSHSKTPIFIGFGSMVIENPKGLLQVLLQGER